MNEMPDYLKRLLQERDELVVRTEKLREFISTGKMAELVLAGDITSRESGYLKCQLSIMDDYVDMLNKRIKIKERN